MKPTRAQIEKVMLDNPRLNIFDLARFLGMEVNEANRVRSRMKIDKERRIAETFENLEFIRGKQ